MFALWACDGDTESALPNVLILYADDMGYGDLAVQNSESKIPTPSLDRLAREGMRFTDGHSSSAICTPSRYALLTGRYHWRSFHEIVYAMGESVIAPERLTLPEMMRSQGYSTAAIGKWHLGWGWSALRNPDAEPFDSVYSQWGDGQFYDADAYDWSRAIPDGPLDHGFDEYFGDGTINFPPYAWIENDRVTQIPDRRLELDLRAEAKEGYMESRPGPAVEDWDFYKVLPTLADRGVAFIEAQQTSDKPFFLYFAFPSPHAPIIPNDEFDGVSGAGAYGDFVNQTDHVAGRLLRALEHSGQADNTIVIFSSDNGAEHYAYRRDAMFDHWSSAPFRGLKRDLYEGGHHVPFIVKWPGVTRPGSVSDALVSQIDIMATLASYLGAELPDDAAEDSHDLLPVLSERGENLRTSHVHNTFAGRYAVRHEQWLLVAARTGYENDPERSRDWEMRREYPADDDTGFELYDLSADPGQRRNVAAEHPEVVVELEILLEKTRERGYSAPRFFTNGEIR